MFRKELRLSVLFVFLMSLLVLIPATSFATTLDENLKNIVHIACGDMEEGEPVFYSYGSGVVIDDGLVLTNAHVSNYIDESEDAFEYDWCIGGIASNAYTAPQFTFDLYYAELWNYSEYFDYEFLVALDPETGEPVDFDSATTYGNADSLVHGDEITLLGYPGFAGETITSTHGHVSGFLGTNWIKTDAVADFGNSGGGAFDSNGNLIGLPTFVVSGALNSITYIQNLNAIIEDAFFGEADPVIIRDFSTIYTEANVTCFTDGTCYQFGEGAEVDLSEEIEIPTGSAGSSPIANYDNPEVIAQAFDSSQHDKGIVNRTVGWVVLQVQEHGEAWYVHPENNNRFYMKNGTIAYQMMRYFGLGITNADLETIPSVDSVDDMKNVQSVCAKNDVANRTKGRILLQVQEHGEAWYVHPETCYRVYMKDGDAAYSIMRFLSLGITNIDLEKIPEGELTFN